MGQIGGDVRGAIGVEGRVDMYYVLPGHNELEAQQVMGSGISSSTSRPQWIYGHTAKPISYFRVLLQKECTI
jgi:hypothetical protein